MRAKYLTVAIPILILMFCSVAYACRGWGGDGGYWDGIGDGFCWDRDCNRDFDCYRRRCFVVPEVPLGTIASLLGMFAAIPALLVVKRVKSK